MSEQNILNPSATSLLNFDWGYTEGLPEMRSVWQAMSGKAYARRQMARGRIYDLAWNKRDLTTKHSLQQWERQYENDFFTLADWERGRYFSGRFDGPLSYSPAGNNAYNIRGRFIELPGLAVYQYPSNWSRDAVFLEERNGFGEDLVKYTGTWTVANPETNTHGGGWAFSNTTNDIAEILYFGYGFRYWCKKQDNLGIVEISLDGIMQGTVDLYDPALHPNGVPTAALFSAPNVALGLHRV